MSFKRWRSFWPEEKTRVESFFIAKLKLVRDYLSEYLLELAAMIWISSFDVSMPSASIFTSSSS